jgi:hypothetical protein
MNDKNKELQVNIEAVNLATADMLLFRLPVDKDGNLIYDLDTSLKMFESFKAELKNKGKENISVIGLPANMDAMFMTREESIRYLEDIIKMLKEGMVSE